MAPWTAIFEDGPLAGTRRTIDGALITRLVLARLPGHGWPDDEWQLLPAREMPPGLAARASAYVIYEEASRSGAELSFRIVERG